MSRNQVIYNVEDLFIGPCPASGFHFINYSGGLNNNYEDLPYVTYESFQHISPNTGIIHAIIPKDKNENTFPRNHNLLKRLDRIQNISYKINSSRTIINHIGKAGTVDRIQLNKPLINLTFSYILSSLRNEARMGFNVNYPRTDYPYTGDKYYYRTDNGIPLFLFSGFFDREYGNSTGFYTQASERLSSKTYPQVVNRGEGIDVNSPCFEPFQDSSSPSYSGTISIPYAPLTKSIWLNEIHYNNAGADLFEYIEYLAHPSFNSNPANTFLTFYRAQGNEYTSPAPTNLGTFNVVNLASGYRIFWKNFTSVGLPQTSGVGVCLSTGLTRATSTPIEFIAYTGTIAGGAWNGPQGKSISGVNGPAIGLLSDVISISGYPIPERYQANSSLPPSNTNGLEAPLGFSLQKTGNGINFGDFFWYYEAAPTTTGQLNNNQKIPDITIYNIPIFVNTFVPFYVGKNLNPFVNFKKSIDLEAGLNHSFSVYESGPLSVTGWGGNANGELTNTINENNALGDFTGIWENTQVGKLNNVKRISSSYAHSLALFKNGTVTGWGPNDLGQAVGTNGYNDLNDLFVGNWINAPISNLTNVSGISAGFYHSLANFNDGKVTGWGDNEFNKALGGNNLTGVSEVAAGESHSLARLITNGKVTGWGDDTYGQITSGFNLTGVTRISVGDSHSIALLANGKVTGWGNNNDGQVAGIIDNDANDIYTGNWNAGPVSKLTGVIDIYAGWFYNLALLNDNTLTGWGTNDAGQITASVNYNDINGIFTGDWNSTIIGSFKNVQHADASYHTSLAYRSQAEYEIASWGEDQINNENLLSFFSLDNYNEYDCITNDPYWPLTTKDKRNIFLAIGEKELDHNDNYEDFNYPDLQNEINVSADRKSQTTRTIGFGNCYLSSYSQSAAVGKFVIADVEYLSENMLFQMSGSGANVPYIDPKKYETNTGIKFNIPAEVDQRNPISALQPGDILIDINSTGYGLDLSDVKVQGYEFNFQFDRESFDAIGYKLPIDRQINLPLFINLKIDFIVGDQEHADFAELIRDDEEYNVQIKCKNSCNYDPNYSWYPANQSSDFEKRFEYVLNYQFFNLKFENISYTSQIGGRKVASLIFTTEVDVEDYNKGLQMSGILGIEKVEDFILIESGNLPALPGAVVEDGIYMLQEDNNLLVSNLQVLY
jgi:alpha-tubulin suppressor-like RCC1 family protein